MVTFILSLLKLPIIMYVGYSSSSIPFSLTEVNLLNCKFGMPLSVTVQMSMNNKNNCMFFSWELLVRNFSSIGPKFVLKTSKPATHLSVLYADRGEFVRMRKSQAIFATD